MFAIYTTKDGVRRKYLTSKRLQQCIEIARVLETEGAGGVVIETDGAEAPQTVYCSQVGTKAINS